MMDDTWCGFSVILLPHRFSVLYVTSALAKHYHLDDQVNVELQMQLWIADPEYIINRDGG